MFKYQYNYSNLWLIALPVGSSLLAVEEVSSLRHTASTLLRLVTTFWPLGQHQVSTESKEAINSTIDRTKVELKEYTHETKTKPSYGTL